MTYLKKYRTPAACYRPSTVRRETPMEMMQRRRMYRRDSNMIATLLEPHKGKPHVFSIITNQPR